MVARIPPGRYRIKIYLDQQGRLEKDYPYELGEMELIGQVDVQSKWPTGYGRMTVVRFPKSG